MSPTHHSVVIEMKDHVIVVEGPLNEERSVALLAETRKLVPGKPIRYVVNSHHHFDHAGGLRAFVAEGVTVITHEVNRAFLEQALGAPATMRPDLQAKSGRKPMVQGVGDRRTLTDGTRTVEIYRIQGILHHDGMLMVTCAKPPSTNNSVPVKWFAQLPRNRSERVSDDGTEPGLQVFSGELFFTPT